MREKNADGKEYVKDGTELTLGGGDPHATTKVEEGGKKECLKKLSGRPREGEQGGTAKAGCGNPGRRD